MKLTVMDFELFNTYYYWSVCWAGLVETNERLETVRTAEVKINPGVKKVHVGDEIEFPFTWEDLKAYPKFDGFSDTLDSYLKSGAVVAGHAVSNDIRMLQAACVKYKRTLPEFTFFDTNLLVGGLKEEYREYSLAALAASFGIEYEQHNPLADALATLEIVRQLCRREACTLEELFARTGVHLGRVKNGLMLRSYSDKQPLKMRFRTEKLNRFYGYAMEHPAAKNGKLAGKRYAFDNELIYHNRLERVLELLLAEGGTVTADALHADHRVVFQLSDKPRRGDTKFSSLLASLDRSLRPRLFYDEASQVLDGARRRRPPKKTE